MQRTEKIDIQKIDEVLASIFQEPATAYQDYSDFDSELRNFDCAESLLEEINRLVSEDGHSANFAIYYPKAKGFIFEEKKSLNPVKCDGATYRYVLNGWGLVMLQIDLREKPDVTVRILVNTEKRAESRLSANPEFKQPSLWEWKYVESQARRVIRTLRKCA